MALQPCWSTEKTEETLLEYSKTHFVKTVGLPFTYGPLSRLLQYNGLTTFGNLIFNGKLPVNSHPFDKPATAILLNLKGTNSKPKTCTQLLIAYGRHKEMAGMHYYISHQVAT